MFVKHGSLAEQPGSALRHRGVPRSRGVCCAWGSKARLLKEVQQVRKDVQDLRSDVGDIDSSIQVLNARVNCAVIVNVGAYLAPVLGLAAVANILGFLDKH